MPTSFEAVGKVHQLNLSPNMNRSYTFLAPPEPSRTRNLSFNEEEFAEKSDLLKAQAINCPWATSKPFLSGIMSSKEFIISPGNILNERNTWRKGNETAPEELYESLRVCLNDRGKDLSDNGDHNDFSSEVITIGLDREVANGDAASTAQRQDLKITGKVFLYSLNPDDISCAIQQGLQNAGTDHFDSLVVSVCTETVEGSRLSIEVLKKVWLVMEEAVSSKAVNMIGLSDVDPQLFMQVYEWARVKPDIVQINLASCCVVPPELAAFTKEHGIQLLTHSDPLNILPREKLEDLSKLLKHEGASCKWETKWVMRYQVHVKCRGVLETKGYIVSITSSEEAC